MLSTIISSLVMIVTFGNFVRSYSLQSSSFRSRPTRTGATTATSICQRLPQVQRPSESCIYSNFPYNSRLLFSKAVDENDRESSIVFGDGSSFADAHPTNYNNLPRLYVGSLPTGPTRIESLSDLSLLSSSAVLSRSPTSASILSDKTVISLSPEQSHYISTVLRWTKLNHAKQKSPRQIRLFDGHSEYLANIEIPTVPSSHAGGGKSLRPTNPRRRTAANALPVVAHCQVLLRRASPVSDVASGSSSNPFTAVEQLDAPAAGSMERDGQTLAESAAAAALATNKCWLCMALPSKKDRLRWLVEKTTELDVAGILSLSTDHSQDTSGGGGSGKKTKKVAGAAVSFEKLAAYVLEAAEQCERLDLPHFVHLEKVRQGNGDSSTLSGTQKDTTSYVNLEHTNDIHINGNDDTSSRQTSPTPFPLLVEAIRTAMSSTDSNNSGNFHILVCRERIRGIPVYQALQDIFSQHYSSEGAASAPSAASTVPSPTVLFLVGPEGGWSQKEQAVLDELAEWTKDSQRTLSSTTVPLSRLRVTNVSLGSNVLRVETAAMAAVAAYTLYADQARNSVR